MDGVFRNDFTRCDNGIDLMRAVTMFVMIFVNDFWNIHDVLHIGNGALGAFTMGGLIFSLLSSKYRDLDYRKKGFNAMMFIIVLSLAGLVSHQFWILSKLSATPTWIFFVMAIAIGVYTLLTYLDEKEWTGWLKIIKPAGTATLTCYLMPYVSYGIADLTGIMKAVHMRMKAYLSLAKALKRPDLKNANHQEVLRISENAMQVSTSEEYLQRLTRSGYRRESPIPEALVIADQFKTDMNTMELNLGEYSLTDEYGVTKHFQVTDKNSRVSFRVTLYFYGGVISGWSVSPDPKSFEDYQTNRI